MYQKWEYQNAICKIPVKIRYLNKEHILKEVKKYANLIKKDENVKKVFLFGSLVREEATPRSDVDLLIILKKSNILLLDRIPKYLPNRFPTTVDVFLYTEEEIERMLKDGNLFIKRILNEGIEI